MAACGYDVEEVVRRSLQVDELSDSDADMDENGDEYDSSEDEDEDNASTHQDDENITQSQGPESPLYTPNSSFLCKSFRLEKGSTDDQPTQQTESDARGHLVGHFWRKTRTFGGHDVGCEGLKRYFNCCILY